VNKPWEKYATPSAGPWAKYASAPGAGKPTVASNMPPMDPGARYPIGNDSVAVRRADAGMTLPVGQTDFEAALDPLSPFGADMQPQVAPPPPVSTAYDLGMAVPDGVRQGFANLLGLPADLVNNVPKLLNLLPGDQGVGTFTEGASALTNLVAGDGTFTVPEGANTAPAGGGEVNDYLLRGAGAIPDYEPQTTAGRIAGRVGEEVGAMAVPAAATLRAANRLGVEGSRQAGGLTRFFVEPAAVDPAGFVGKEVSAAAAAGAGAGVANEVANNQDRSNPLIDLIGALGGVTLANTGKTLLNAVVDLGAAAVGSERYAGNVVRNAVSDQLVSNSSIAGRQVTPENMGKPIDTQELVDAVMRPSAAEQKVPGFQASTADRAADPGLASLENARSRNNPGMFRARTDANTQAVEGAMGGLAPTETPGTFRGALEDRVGSVLGEAANVTDAARTAFNDAVAPLRPLMTAEGRGAEIRAALEGASAKAKEVVSAAWGPLNQAADPVDIAPLADSFAQADASVPVALQPLTPRASSVPGQLAETSATQPVSEVMGIRTALTNDLRREGITPQEVRLIEDRIARLDAYVEQALPAELTTAYSEARTATREFSDRFTRQNTAIGQSLRTTEGGGYALPDSAVPRKFVQGDQGRLADTEALFKEAGSDPRATTAVRDQLLQDARDRGALEDPRMMDRFMSENSEILKRYPDLKADLTKASGAKTALTGAEKTQTGLIDRLTKPGKSAVATYLSFDNNRAVDAIRSVLNSRSPAAAADELLTFVDDAPQAVEGARAAFWRHLDGNIRSKNAMTETDSGVMPIVPRKMAAFLDDPVNAAVAERLYRDNPEHLADIKQLAEVLRGTGTASRVGNAVNPSGTAQMMRGQAPVSMAELGSKFYQMQLGRVSPAYLAAHIAGKISSRAVGSQRAKAFEALLDKALLDPETAAMLLRENNPANRAALARTVNLWRLNHGDALVQMLEEDDQTPDDEMRRSIMGDQ
jgi:hypothetical protein